MFKLFVVCALIGIAAAAGTDADLHAEVKTLTTSVLQDGFNYLLETTNGIHTSQTGDANGNIKGEYFYTSPEGVPVKVSYVADENGYQPISDLLPTPPPVPAQIVRALEYLRTHATDEEKTRVLKTKA